MSKELEFPKSKTIHEAIILEIAFDFSACVLPDLNNGLVKCFTFCKFEFFRHSYNKFSIQNLLDLFSLWATLVTLGDNTEVKPGLSLGPS